MAFFTLALALKLYWILLIVNEIQQVERDHWAPFYPFSLLSPTLLLTFMRCS